LIIVRCTYTRRPTYLQRTHVMYCTQYFGRKYRIVHRSSTCRLSVSVQLYTRCRPVFVHNRPLGAYSPLLPSHVINSKHGNLDIARRTHQRLTNCATRRTMNYSAKLFDCRTIYCTHAKSLNQSLMHLLPSSNASQRYNLRHRAHSLQLPKHLTQLSDSNFLTRMLYKNTYYAQEHILGPVL